MKITLETLLSSQQGFNELSQLKAGDIKPMLAFDIAETFEKINLILKAYNKIVSDLRNKYSEPNDSGEFVIQPSSKKEREFIAELMEVQGREYDLDIPYITKNDLIKDDQLLITIGALTSLLWMFNRDKK